MTIGEVKNPKPNAQIQLPSSAESLPGQTAHTAVNVQGVPGGTPVTVTVEDLDTLATEATLLDVKTAIENIEVTVPPVTIDTTGLATDVKQDLQQVALDAIKTELQSGTLDIHITDASVAVSAASLPLPTGAATETTLATRASETTAALIKAAVESLVSALPPGGASKEATQLLVKAALDAIKAAVEGTLDVNIVSGVAPGTEYDDGEAVATPKGVVAMGYDGANAQALSVNASGELKVQVQNAAPDAATETTLALVKTAVDAIKTAVEGVLDVEFVAPQHVIVDSGAVTANLGTIAGVATETTLDAVKTAVDSINTKLTNPLPVTGSVTATVTGVSTAVKQDEQTTELVAIKNELTTGTLDVHITDASVAVTAASLPLPTGAATSSNQTTLGAQTTKLNDGTNTASVSAAGALKVDGSAVTQPVSAASLPLPTGAATEVTLATRAADATITARLNTLGQKTGANSAPVVLASDQTAIPVTDNGASLTVDTTQLPSALVGGRLVVDGSGVTQPVSGTVTANVGTTNGLALDATLTGGTQKAIARGGAKGSTTAADVTSTAEGADHQAIDVQIYHGGAAKDPTQIRSLASGTDSVTIVPSGTQTVSGTVTANIGTSGALALDATLTGGTQKSITRGGAKGSTTAADVTSTAAGSNHQALDVAILDASGNQITSFGSAPSDTVVTGAITGAAQTVDSGALNGQGTIALSVTGTFTATLAIEASFDGGSNYVSWVARSQTTSTFPTTLTVGTPVVVPSSGATNIRVRCSAYTSGTANVRLVVSAPVAGVHLLSPLPAGSATIGAVTVSGTPSVTSSTLALDATLTGGTQKSITRGGAKGSTTAADVTSTASGANHQAVDVVIYDTSGNAITTFGGGTEYTSGDPTTGSAQGGVAFGVESGNNAYPIAVDSSGRQIIVDGGGSISIDDNSGSITVDGTVAVSNSFALDTTLTSGSQKSITRGGAKGSTTAADVTSTASGANHQPLDVAIYDASGNQITSFGGVADATNSGNITAISQTVNLTLNGHGSASIQVTGTWSGTLSIKGTVDGTNYANIYARQTASTNPITNAFTQSTLGTNAILKVNTSGLVGLQVNSTAWTSGTAVVTMRATPAAGSISFSDTLGAGVGGTTPVLGQVGISDTNNVARVKAASTPAAFTDEALVVSSHHGNASVRIGDGTSTLAGVKGASTAAVAADPALVVALSPNTGVVQGSAAAIGNSWYTKLSDGSTGPVAVMPSGSPALPTTIALAVDVRPSNSAYYSASGSSFTPAATPTDILTIVGSGTKTVRVQRITLQTYQTTAGVNQWFIIKRSTANSGGTISSATLVPHDSNYSAASCTVQNYTANAASLGTAVGNIRVFKQFASTSTTWEESETFDFTNGGRSKGIVLRGTSQVLALNFNGAALPAGLNVNWHIEWIEE